ncbi:DNA-J related domain-containing protein [Marinobacter sp. SS21]|uniref:DNA-J related domain-containing protein n=1 Tax=Marinobacter sp. SS21 TaxID=2979460 RepID=UPI00232B0A05|nr:DNA-J related domain-containing protein [Marinobacter sp. SS21]MDC0662066.1 DNA-J related domain-containing protein [Marinobacter sp. SS21]
MNASNALPQSPEDPSGQHLLSELVQQLLVAIERVLRDHPAGISELDLIKTLQADPWHLLAAVDFSTPAQLYPVHFLVFHTLYRLRDQVATRGESLAISPLRIQLGANTTVAGNGLPDTPDGLRAFYLDLSQYGLSEQAIERLMTNFWSGRIGQPPDANELQQAARVLGFESLPDQLDTVKRQFRRAVMRSHPDRGGDTQRIQALNEAFALIKAHFQQVSSAD